MLDLDLKDRVAVVTGAGGAIGRSVCLHLAAGGAGIAAVDIDLGAAGATAAAVESEGGQAMAERADAASAGEVERTVSAVAERFGRLDFLVNCAGIYPRHMVLEMRPEDWQRVIDVNLTGSLLFCQAALRVMVPRRFGRIVNIASGHAFYGGTGHAHYAASKAGIIGLTRALAHEFGPHGIRANVISPTLTDTPMPRQHLSEEFLRERAARNPARRIGRPEDIARGAVFLCSSLAEYVNGHTLMITGGDFM